MTVPRSKPELLRQGAAEEVEYEAFKRFKAVERREQEELSRKQIKEGKQAMHISANKTYDVSSEEEEWDEETPEEKGDEAEDEKAKMVKEGVNTLKKAMRRGEGSEAHLEAFKALCFKSPFTDEINEAQVSRSLKMANFKRYNGTGDPDDHVSNFVWAIRMTRMDPRLWCISFAGTLDGSARYWLESLPSRSIGSFQQLCEEFTASFIQQRIFQQEAQSIFSCRQRDGESSKAYLERLNEVSRKMPTRNDPMIIAAFTYGLRPGFLFKKLVLKSFKSTKEILEKVNKYIRQEEQAAEKLKIEPASRSKAF